MASAEKWLDWATEGTDRPGVHFAPALVKEHSLASACTHCSLRGWCGPGVPNAFKLHQLSPYAEKRLHLRRGHGLYAAGARFENLYCVRSGFMKTSVPLSDGREQVTGFHMPGDLIGMDGISTDCHNGAATAIEASEVCLLPFSRIEQLSITDAALQHHLHRLLSSEVVRIQYKMLMLGTMHAQEKVAWFLLDLSARYAQRGYSAAEFNLRMTREEIGSFLGLKLETVSRVLSRFHDAGLVIVRQKYVKLRDPEGLRQLS